MSEGPGLQQFVEWLEVEQRTGRLFSAFDCMTCPVASWLTARGFRRVRVFADSMSWIDQRGEWRYLKNPGWVGAVVRKLNGLAGQQVTAGQVIEIARGIDG